MTEKINILAISSGNTGGVAFHRIMVPLDYLYNNSDKFNVVYAPDEGINIDAENLYNIDICHFHANITYNKPLMERLYDMQKKGCKLVMDMDDYPIIPLHNPAHKAYNEKLKDNIINNLSKVDCITTTTKLFKNELKKSTKTRIEVFPNVIDNSYEQFINRPTESRRLRIGLVGGASHFKDIDLLEGMAAQLIDYKDKIQFVVCGFDLKGTDNPALNMWNDVERNITANYTIISEEYKDYLFRYDREEYPNVENEPFRRIWTKSISEYGKIYNDIDVLIAPLVNDKFNCMKSELKVVEAGNFGKVFIGSSVGQYKEVITNGYDGLLIPSHKNTSGWANAIKSLINNKELYYYLQSNLFKLNRDKYSIDKWNIKRELFYKSIMK